MRTLLQPITAFPAPPVATPRLEAPIPLGIDAGRGGIEIIWGGDFMRGGGGRDHERGERGAAPGGSRRPRRGIIDGRQGNASPEVGIDWRKRGIASREVGAGAGERIAT